MNTKKLLQMLGILAVISGLVTFAHSAGHVIAHARGMCGAKSPICSGKCGRVAHHSAEMIYEHLCNCGRDHTWHV